MKLIMSQPQKEDIIKRFFRFLHAPYVNYYNLRAEDRTGHELAAAMSVAKDLYHFREWLPSPLSDFDRVVAACPDYAILRDVTNVDKHFYKNKPNKHGPPFLVSKDDIKEVDIVTWYRDDIGDYQNHQQAIFLHLQNGPMKGYYRDLLRVMTNVINHWIDVLFENGLIKDGSHFPFVEVRYISREEAKTSHSPFSSSYPLEVEVHHYVYNPYDNTLSNIDPNVPRLVKFKIEWDMDTGQCNFKAAFEPESNREGWILKATDSEGNQIQALEVPVTHKIGPY